MPKICYKDNNFNAASLALIDKANEIITEYRAQGYTLTVRQLYYQFVARDLIPNTMKSYKRLADRLNIGRLAGMIERVCRELDMPYLSCRGYTSQSEMWASAMRLKRLAKHHGQTPMILHFGDHDPSGLDMTRDIIDRLELFAGPVIQLERLALNMDQVEQWKLPPNPAKTTDSRFRVYVVEFGNESWELDALEPKVLHQLIADRVGDLRDQVKWDKAIKVENGYRERLQELSESW